MTKSAQLQTFRLPDLGEGLTEGQVVQWLVREGDEVAVDQAIAEVETAKSIVEVPSPYAGRVETLHAAEGDTVDVGAPLISVAPTADSSPLSSPPSALGAEEPNAEAATYREEEQAGSGNVLIGYGTQHASRAGRRRRPRVGASAQKAVEAGRAQNGGVPRVVSPLVRRLANERGVDVAGLSGTGRGGVITRSDVEVAAANTQPPAGHPVAVVAETNGQIRIPLNGFRKAVSAALSRSRSEIPEATVWVDVDATELWSLRENTRTATDPGPGLLAYLARFTVAALREYPVLNAQFDAERDEIIQSEAINLGLAVQSDRGLVVPAVMGADRLTTAGLDREIRTMTTKARDGRCSPEELSAGTFTLNNYGGFRVDGSAAIINYPQVAILGFGRMIERPWVVDGEIVPRRITQMSLVFDHRVCDGGTAAGFMRSIADTIENPIGAIRRL